MKTTTESYRLTIFTGRDCRQIARISEIHGRDAQRFSQAIRDHGRKVECRTYREFGVRIDDMRE